MYIDLVARDKKWLKDGSSSITFSKLPYTVFVCPYLHLNMIYSTFLANRMRFNVVNIRNFNEKKKCIGSWYPVLLDKQVHCGRITELKA